MSETEGRGAVNVTYVPGCALRAMVMRQRDGAHLDWADGAFKPADVVAPVGPLAEHASIPGVYTLALDLATWEKTAYILTFSDDGSESLLPSFSVAWNGTQLYRLPALSSSAAFDLLREFPAPPGPRGPQGLIGPPGGLGPKGDPGPAGPLGAIGPVGAVGPIGATGPQGAPGPKGDPGSAGATGPAGPQGAAGAIGATGPAGPTGAQGPAGLIGLTGAPGPAGPAGPTGATGPQGPIGPGASATAATSGTTGVMTVTMPSVDQVITITPTGACTFNASGGVAGARCTFVITTTGTTSFTLTFGTTNFKTTGPLATGTVSGKVFAVSFVYTGALWIETARTVAM